MRILWFVVAVVTIAALAWMRVQAPRADEPARRDAARSVAADSNHSNAAGNAVRSAHVPGSVGQAAQENASRTQAAPAVSDAVPAPATSASSHLAISATAATAPATVRSAAPPTTVDASARPTQKPAAELFDGFIKNDPSQVFAPATVNYHAAVQGETQDPQWGPAAAAALRDYIVDHFGDRYEIPYVDCRQDLCELQVVSRLGGDRDNDMRDIQLWMSQMRHEPWWTTLEFDQEHGIVTTAQDDRVILLWFFSRK